MAKWIQFVELDQPKRKTKVFEVCPIETKISLGTIEWLSSWKRYSFFPSEDTAFESTCLRDIAQFCDDLMAERKNRS